MSSILEALRKLEEEKVARRRGMGHIAGKVTSAGRRARQRRAWLAPAGMAAVAVVAVLVTYAVMGGFSPRHGETVSSAKPEPAAPVPAIPGSQAATPDGSKSATPQTRIPLPARLVTTPVPPATTLTGKASPAPTSALRRPDSPPSYRRENPVGKRVDSPQTPLSEQLPAISVTGIAWQKDSASRLAVVNGFSAAEGSLIEGALVKKILPDRVRFSFNRREFEVYLGKGSQ